MGQLIINTDDSPEVMRAARNMLSEILGDPELVYHIAAKGDAPTAADETPHKGPGEGDQTGPPVDDSATETPGAHDTGGDPARVDPNGVAFDPEMCGNAARPFYGSGKRKGQWKKRQGVDDKMYDDWYAAQLVLVAAKPADDGGDQRVDTSAAFNTQQADDTTQQNAAPVPEDCGGFMGWVSAKQAAELLTQQDIGDAYTTAGLQVTDLFPPNDPATVKTNVTMLYQILVVKAGA